MRKTARDIDEYIGWFDGDVRARLERVRSTMHAAAPGAGEKISYAIPTLTVDGRPLIYFAGFEHHISVYPVPRENPAWKKELATYDGGKGTLRLPHAEPVPYDLIERLTKFRLNELRRAPTGS